MYLFGSDFLGIVYKPQRGVNEPCMTFQNYIEDQVWFLLISLCGLFTLINNQKTGDSQNQKSIGS